MKLDNIYMGDFETTTSENYEKDGCVRVWLWGLMNISNRKDYKLGKSIETFFRSLPRKPIVIYFHNLRFDGSFIIDYLFFNLKIPYRPFDGEKDELWFNYFKRDGNIYQIKYNINKKINYRFHCSLNIFHMSIESIIGKDKILIDYNKYRDLNYKPSRQEYTYLYNDIYTVAGYLYLFLKTFEYKRKFCLTSSAYSFTHFKETLPKYFYDDNLDVLSIDQNKDLRKFYQGGYGYVNEKYQQQIITKPIYVYDVNSMYPSIMRDCSLPYGHYFIMKPKTIDEINENMFNLIEINFKNIEIKSDFPPILIEKRSNYQANTYLKKAHLYTAYLTLDELKWVMKFYKYKSYEIIQVYEFNSRKGLFDGWLNHWYTKKKISKKKTIEYLTAKIMLNACYGKFGQKNVLTRRLIDEQLSLEKGQIIEYEISNETKKVYYIPIAIAITSLARCKLYEQIYNSPKDFYYCDTDSIHTSKPFDDKYISDDELGKWKLETISEKYVYYRRYKCYQIDDNIKVAGLNKKNHNMILNKLDTPIILKDAKLNSSVVKGGMLIKATTWELK